MRGLLLLSQVHWHTEDLFVKITDAFLGEHAILYAQFAHLEQVTSTAETVDVVRSLAATLNATLISHANLEDELLFSALGPIGPVAVMRMEHAQIEALLGTVPDTRELHQAQNLLIQALQIARNHFSKEEQMLFPLSERMLDQSVLVELAFRWADRRGVLSV